MQHLGQEIAVTAGGLQETRVDALGFLFHHVEHGIHFARPRVYLAVVGNALFRFDLRGQADSFLAKGRGRRSPEFSCLGVR